MNLTDEFNRRARAVPGVWRGKITRFSAAGKPFVEIRRLVPGYEFGPVDILQGPWTIGLITTTVEDTDSDAEGSDDTAFSPHSHEIKFPLASGDDVLVAFIEGRQDEPVILGRLT